MSIDEDDDGTVDSTRTYAYDDDGRIVSVTRESDGGSVTTSVTYQYEDGVLVTKTDGTDTVTYVTERGRVVVIENTLENERATFDRDERGRLLSFTENGPADDDDTIASSEPSETEPPTTTITTDVVRDDAGRVVRLEERGGGREIRFERDADGRLVSFADIPAEDPEFPSFVGELPTVQTLTRDERGRIVGSETSGDVEQSVQMTYEADRLASYSVSRTFESSFGSFSVDSRAELEYTADGLLDRSTLVTDLDGPDGSERTTEVRTFEYESPACAPQTTNDPRTMIFAEAVGTPSSSLAALECAYVLDEELDAERS